MYQAQFHTWQSENSMGFYGTLGLKSKSHPLALQVSSPLWVSGFNKLQGQVWELKGRMRVTPPLRGLAVPSSAQAFQARLLPPKACSDALTFLTFWWPYPWGLKYHFINSLYLCSTFIFKAFVALETLPLSFYRLRGKSKKRLNHLLRLSYWVNQWHEPNAVSGDTKAVLKKFKKLFAKKKC